MKRKMKLAAGAVALAAVLGAAQAARADIINWTLSDGTFDDGGVFSGTFTFDTVSDTITDWNIATTASGTFFTSETYQPGGSFISGNSAFDNGVGPSFETFFLFFGSTFRLTNIPLATPGTVAALTGDESASIFGTPVSFHTVTGGEAVGVLAAAPEPLGWALMITGMGGAGAMLRRRRSAQTA